MQTIQPTKLQAESIILAGGLGTRLRSAVPDLPKCMAPVCGKPFIGYVIDYFLQQGVEKFILSLGYKSEAITAYIEQDYPNLQVQFVIEAEPLGTGGAIQFALSKATEDHVFVTNGDTMFAANLAELLAHHTTKKAHCTLSLKPMHNFDRYGVVELNDNQAIVSFKEKQHYDSGLINGGLYILNKEQLLAIQLPIKYSFEKDYLEAYYQEGNMYGLIQEAYFIDIGIPQDYAQAQKDFAQVSSQNRDVSYNLRFTPIGDCVIIDKTWTLFIDRDGVLNHEKKEEYIRNWDEFTFYDGVLEALAKLNQVFGTIVLVTNQKGVGKGLMTEGDLHHIHQNMLQLITNNNGRIDKIYYCSDLENDSPNRKPNAGMAFQAKQDFPHIDFTKSLMVGNKLSDMGFGRNAGIKTVFVATTNPETPFPHPSVDYRFEHLQDFASALTKA